MSEETDKLLKQIERQALESELETHKFEQEMASDDLSNILAKQRIAENKEIPIILRKEDRDLFE